MTSIDVGCIPMPKKTPLISKIIFSTVLLLVLAPQDRQVAQQPPGMLSQFLLRRPCVSTGIGNVDRRTENVSVGKAVYKSRLFMGPGNAFAAITCRLQPNEPGVVFQTLRLAFGMRDNDQGSPAATVNIYLDQASTPSYTVSPGRAATVTLDVSRTSNVSIEVRCTSASQYCDRVYFWDAYLDYPPLPKR